MTTDSGNGLQNHPVVSRDEWLAARIAFLAKEKEFTQQREELSRQRRALPWVKVDKEYVFNGPNGRETLADLFETRNQLVVYHFMFTPEWDEGCPHCSFWADTFDGIPVHLQHRDVSFVAISRAPLAKLEAYQRRMGWHFKWVSAFEGDFNFDFNVSFTPQQLEAGTAFYNYQRGNVGMEDREGISVFYKDPVGAIYHTYSTFARGIDAVNSAYQFLDLVPKGRDEDVLPWPQDWVRRHDRYDA